LHAIIYLSLTREHVLVVKYSKLSPLHTAVIIDFFIVKESQTVANIDSTPDGVQPGVNNLQKYLHTKYILEKIKHYRQKDEYIYVEQNGTCAYNQFSGSGFSWSLGLGNPHCKACLGEI
jgi:hypothetical protein